MTSPTKKLSAGVLSYIGELCGAAFKDIDAADPADVGLEGVPIRQWRKAYYEGCKDMAEGIISRLPEGERAIAAADISRAFEKEIGRAALESKE